MASGSGNVVTKLVGTTVATPNPGAATAVRLPIHPLLLVTAFVLQKAASEGVPLAGFARPLLVGLIAITLMTVIGAAATRSWQAGGMVATLSFLLVISHDPVIWLLRAIRDLLGVAGGTAVLAVVVTSTLVGGGYGVVRLGFRPVPSTRRMRRLTSGLNTFGAILVVVVALAEIPQVPRWLPTPSPVAVPVSTAPSRPDIYLILLDGYPRADELESQFALDNSRFLADLMVRDFDVQERSRSNYTNTALTLPSLLGMDYLTATAPASFTDAALRGILDDALRTGPGFRSLRQAGYELLATSPGWEHVSLRAGVDRMVERPELTDLEQSLLWSTWLPDLPGVPPSLFFDQLYSRVLGGLSDAVTVAASEHQKPRFVFVHVPAPHLPLVFGADGGPARYATRLYGAKSAADYGLTDLQFKAAYAASIRTLNALVLNAIDGILMESAGDPIILVMSDHGYDGSSGDGGDSKLRNLFAAHTPDEPGLLNSVTPVNVLRELLRAYAGIDAGPRLPDRYFHTSIQDHITTIIEAQPPG